LPLSTSTEAATGQVEVANAQFSSQEAMVGAEDYGKGVTVTTAANSQAEADAILSHSRSCYVTLRLVGVP
jgi:hypothetical protein